MVIVVFCGKRGWDVLIYCDNTMRRVEVASESVGIINSFVHFFHSYIRKMILVPYPSANKF
jgi:hypothetical protein